VSLTVESVAMRSGQEAGAPRHNWALARASAAPTMASRPPAANRKISALDILDIVHLRTAPLLAGRPKHRHRRAAVAGHEGHLDRLPDGDLVEGALDDAGRDGRALSERHEGGREREGG